MRTGPGHIGPCNTFTSIPLDATGEEISGNPSAQALNPNSIIMKRINLVFTMQFPFTINLLLIRRNKGISCSAELSSPIYSTKFALKSLDGKNFYCFKWVKDDNHVCI